MTGVITPELRAKEYRSAAPRLASSDDSHLEDGYPADQDEDWPPCPTCRGSGVVDPLTNPDWAPFIASYGTCPSCDGTGECP